MMGEDWSLLIEKRNEAIRQQRQGIEQEVHMEADIQVALEVGRMAELGWFDVEFTMYGCAYWNPVDDKLYCKVSSLAEDIYDFIEKGMQENIYASNVMTLTQKMPVPSGMRELIAQDVKWELARKLQKTYPKEFFQRLYHLAEQYTDDSAAKLLWEEVESLEGVFEEERLRRFEELVQYAYSCRKITKGSYQKLLAWIREERRNMDDDFISKDIQEKTMYGIAYEEEDHVRYIENAQREYVYEKVYALEKQGIFATTVYSKTYWYNYEYRLMDVIKDFKALVRKELDENYRNKIKAIRAGYGNENVEAFRGIIAEVQENWGDACSDTLIRYGYRWGILIPTVA